MDDFKKRFLDEAFEHVNALEQALLELENNTNNKELIVKVFRAMHSLKGGGAMFGFDKVSEFTHNLESIYDLVRNDQIKMSNDLFNITLKSVDHLKNLLNEETIPFSQVESDHNDLLSKIREITGKMGAPVVPVPVKEPVKKKVVETDIPSDKKIQTYYIIFQPKENIFDNGTNPLYLLDEINSLGTCCIIPHLNKVPDFDIMVPTLCYTYWEIFIATKEDVNTIANVFIFVEDDSHIEIHKLSDQNLFEHPDFKEKLASLKKDKFDLGINNLQKFVKGLKKIAPKEQTKTETQRNSTENKEKKTEERKQNIVKENSISSIRVSSEKLDLLMNLVSELVTTQARLSLYSEVDESQELNIIAENVQKLSRQLRDVAFSIVLIPIENLITRFQRLVRDLSGELKKDVSFVAEGTETELDKTIIENLTDPLMHILRNSMDHGIELPEEREKKGKNKQGQIKLKAFYSGANVIIQVSDDGAGMDTERIRQKAISKGIITNDAILSQKELLDIIFLPGFSTATNVSDVSGRGVGMDVVKKKISDIRGEVELESKVNVGTTITIKLPLTLSIIDGLLVKIADVNYIIPLSLVQKVYAIEHTEITGLFNNILILDEVQIPFFYLRNEFDLPENENKIEEIVIVKYDDKQVGLIVDTVVGEYQAVLKPLGKHYKKQHIVSSATILGDGTVALVMDSNKAIRYFSNQAKLMEETT